MPHQRFQRFVFYRFDLFTEDSANGGRVGVIVYDAAGVYNMISIGDYENRDDLMYKIDILDFIQRTEMADNAIGKLELDFVFIYHLQMVSILNGLKFCFLERIKLTIAELQAFGM